MSDPSVADNVLSWSCKHSRARTDTRASFPSAAAHKPSKARGWLLTQVFLDNLAVFREIEAETKERVKRDVARKMDTWEGSKGVRQHHTRLSPIPSAAGVTPRVRSGTVGSREC